VWADSTRLAGVRLLGYKNNFVNGLYLESLYKVPFFVGCVSSKSVTHRENRIQSLMGYARVTAVTSR